MSNGAGEPGTDDVHVIIPAEGDEPLLPAPAPPQCTFVSVVPPPGTSWTNIPPEGIRIEGGRKGTLILGISGDPALQDEIRYEVHADGSVTTDIPGCTAVITDGHITGFSFSPGEARPPPRRWHYRFGLGGLGHANDPPQ